MFSSLISMSGFDSVNKRYSYKRDPNNLDRTTSTNTLKTINCVRTLPFIKSKSFNSVKSRIDNESTCSDQLNSVNLTRRRQSWFERRTWSFRRGNKRNLKNMETSPDITIIFTKDAFEWDEYLTECFSQMIDYQPLTILHERIENINFPIGSDEAQNFSNSRAILLILSPDFLDFIDAHAEVFELSRLLNPKRTVVMLCGVQEQDISRFHKAALVSYDQWTCLVAKDQDKEFVLSVIQAVLLIIQQNENNTSNKPQFKLSPRKVREGNGKVFILLENPINEKQQIQILFDGSNENHLSVKWKNPYTLYFTIPDSLLKKARVVNISLICDKNFIGTRPIKCETKMSELHSLLTSVNSPFEFMCQTLGFATLSEVDAELANRFDQSLPNSGLMFLCDADTIGTDKKKSDCYLPTLLHFATAYGLRELTSKLLQCPSALKACQMRNSNNLTPAEIAYHLNHSDIGAILEDFQRLYESGKINLLHECEPILESEQLTDQEKANLKTNASYRPTNSKLSAAHHQLYGMPFPSISSQNKEKAKFLTTLINKDSRCDQSIYSENSNFKKQEAQNELENSKTNRYESRPNTIDNKSITALKVKNLLHLSDKNQIKNRNEFDLSVGSDKNPLETSSSSADLKDIHKELLYIIETFKKGMSFDKFESMFDNWQSKHQNVLSGNLSKEMNDSLGQIQVLCKIGRKQQKLETTAKQSFTFNDLRNYLTSKLQNKAKDKVNLPEKLHSLTLKNEAQDEQQAKYTIVSSSSLSSVSTNSSSCDRISSVSNGSLFDSGNNSAESQDENSKLDSRNYRNNYYKHPKTKTTSLVSKVNESQVRAKQLDSVEIIKCSKPPAPPPRPLNVSISEANEFNESINLNNHHYYMFQNIAKLNNSEDEQDLDHYEISFKEIKDKDLGSVGKPNPNQRSKSHSLSDVNNHQYVNMTSSRIESPIMAKRDPLTDYDLVPSGIPIPIGFLKGKVSFPIHSLRKQAEDDYDIPRTSQITSSDLRVRLEQSSDNCNDEKSLENDRNIDRQVFV